MGEINVKKSENGFTMIWVIILIYSVVMLFLDFKLAILGFLIVIAFGYLGFDLVMHKLLDKE